jgi:hypothetical protein
MSKEDSFIMKGVAIMIMLFFHLFEPKVQLYNGTMYAVLARANNPVPFYLILSGYGLFIVNRKTDFHRYSRLINLYIHYWIISLIFILMGYFICNKVFAIDALTILLNMIGYNTSYNHECWFLLPYVLLALSSPFLFKFLDWIRIKYSIVIFYGIYILSSYMNRYEFFRGNAFQYFYLLFPFVLGALMVKSDFIRLSRDFLQKYKIYPWILLLLIVVARCFVYTGAVISFYAAAFITLFVLAKRPIFVDNILMHLGKHSMNMWMIHTWFCYYLFHDFIYGFKYPILIWLVLIVISYLSSVIVNLITVPLIKILRTDKIQPKC